jgi:chromate transporter
MNTALSAVTAAVVGVILNLAVWFGMHTLWPAQRLDWFAAVLSGLAIIALLRWKAQVITVIALSGFAGLIYQLAL